MCQISTDKPALGIELIQDFFVPPESLAQGISGGS
ncbi:Uncharacterised protein [Yersinia nurmii]|uniref:Uncharacterized protein n=1 Tax=Yersinia nurmii TaxID=685706 RepID=A0ABM9SL78_9GAMM|nr:Uncharacterised protein [Yersinia nurmii]